MRTQTGRRTGPLGRLARFVLMAVLALTLLSIVDARGSARFRNPHILLEPSAWLIHFLMFVVFIILVRAVASALGGPRVGRRWQLGALVATAGVVAVAAGVGIVTHGAAWGFPLADLVWWFDVLVLGQEIVALLLAIALGTPGCEIGVWGELIARARGTLAPTDQVLACIVGLHLIDRWESGRANYMQRQAVSARTESDPH